MAKGITFGDLQLPATTTADELKKLLPQGYSAELMAGDKVVITRNKQSLGAEKAREVLRRKTPIELARTTYRSNGHKPSQHPKPNLNNAEVPGKQAALSQRIQEAHNVTRNPLAVNDVHDLDGFRRYIEYLRETEISKLNPQANLVRTEQSLQTINRRYTTALKKFAQLNRSYGRTIATLTADYKNNRAKLFENLVELDQRAQRETFLSIRSIRTLSRELVQLLAPSTNQGLEEKLDEILEYSSLEEFLERVREIHSSAIDYIKEFVNHYNIDQFKQRLIQYTKQSKATPTKLGPDFRTRSLREEVHTFTKFNDILSTLHSFLQSEGLVDGSLNFAEITQAAFSKLFREIENVEFTGSYSDREVNAELSPDVIRPLVLLKMSLEIFVNSYPTKARPIISLYTNHLVREFEKEIFQN